MPPTGGFGLNTGVQDVLSNPVTDYVPTGRPGARAPHVWLERDGVRLSTLDLFGDRFVLLAGAGGTSWRDAASPGARELAVPIAAFTVGTGGDVSDPETRWPEVYGVKADGAVLCAPTGTSAGAPPRRRATRAASGLARSAACWLVIE
jgi:hypothetical protein